MAAGDGDDTLIVDDALYPAGVWGVQADLGGADGDLDRVVVHDSDEGNQTSVSFFSDRVSVLAEVWTTLTGAEPTDRLRVNGNDGDDIVSASTDAMALTLDGGDGDNVILGGPGRDTLIGGDGFDDVKGGSRRRHRLPARRLQPLQLGAGRRQRHRRGRPDPRLDVLRRQRRRRDLRARASRRHARFTRDVGNIVMDLDGIDSIEAMAGAGADTFRIGDMRGTDVSELNASLAPGGGAGDPDRVEIEGTEGDDAVAVSGKKVVFGSVTVTGLPVKLGISFAQIGFDSLAIDTLGGDDSVDTAGLGPDVISLEVN